MSDTNDSRQGTDEASTLDLDTALMILQNPVRRRIIEFLTMEKHYPLQLARKIGVSQQAVQKNLDILEKYGIVESHMEDSPDRGPQRKYYILKKSFSLTVDVGRNMFRAEVTEHSTERPAERRSLDRELEDIYSERDPVKRLNLIYRTLIGIQDEITGLEKRRYDLLAVSDALMEEAHAIISGLYRDYDRRLVAYHLLEFPHTDIENLAYELDIRERIIREILRELGDLDFI